MNRIYNDSCIIKNSDTVPYIYFTSFGKYENDIVFGFSTRLGGVSTGCFESMNLSFERGDDPAAVTENYRRIGMSMGFDYTRVVSTNQWHTTNIRKVGPGLCGEGIVRPRTADEIDGQITDVPGVVLMAYGADCPSIYLYDPENRAIGLVHSGWKGTLNDIAGTAVRRMTEEYASLPENISAVIGPSVCADCYEVSEDVALPFAEKYSVKIGDDSEFVKKGRRDGKYQLDLWACCKRNLSDAGLRPDNISVSGLCTMHEKTLMYSHRRDGAARGSMAGFIMLK